MMKRFQAEGCGLWALLALVVILLCTGLLVYIDRRFGPEASAFFLGLLLGIPFLLVVVLIVGGIYILVIRGATHLQERDDIGEVERLRALRELARTERSAMQNERTTFDAQRRDSRLLDAWRQRQAPPTDAAPWGPPPRSLPSRNWPDEEDDTRHGSDGPSYQILD